jgi:hypothetical protein
MQAAAFKPAQISAPPISPQPTLNVQPNGTNVVISWNAASTGFVLQASPSLAPAAWVPVTNAPVSASGQQTVTVPMTDQLQFYRLVQ